MDNKRLEKSVTEMRTVLDESSHMLRMSENALKMIDERLVKTQKAIYEAQLCIEATRGLLKHYPLVVKTIPEKSSQCDEFQRNLSRAETRQKIALELRYFSHLVEQLVGLDEVYYGRLRYHYQKLAEIFHYSL